MSTESKASSPLRSAGALPNLQPLHPEAIFQDQLGKQPRRLGAYLENHMKRISVKKVLPVLMFVGALLSTGIIAGAQTQPKMRRSTRRPATRLVPVGTSLRIRLQDTLSS